MVVDFLLDVLFTVLGWLVGVLPVYDIEAFLIREGVPTGLLGAVALVNYHLPLEYVIVVGVVVVPILLGKALFNFILKLIPGMG